LLSADLGVSTTREILDAVREKLDRNALSDSAQLKTEIKSHIVRILNAASKPTLPAVVAGSTNGKGPRVIFIVGVNGAGKTTSIGKLANRLRKEGLSVILCAADTFRAAAVEQLEIWAQRNGIEVIKQKSGADPAAVVYDAVADCYLPRCYGKDAGLGTRTPLPENSGHWAEANCPASVLLATRPSSIVMTRRGGPSVTHATAEEGTGTAPGSSMRRRRAFRSSRSQ